LTLRSGKFDPLGDIPIVSVGSATWTESSTDYRIAKFDPQPNRDDYLPLAYGSRYWDDPRLLPAPRQFRNDG
jgi:acetoacetate decarboxylase